MYMYAAHMWSCVAVYFSSKSLFGYNELRVGLSKLEILHVYIYMYILATCI